MRHGNVRIDPGATLARGSALRLRYRSPQLNLRRLKYFVKIVDIGSLTQAADVLHIAQPALSQQLATLEGEFRQQLLVRTKRGVTPTDAGMVLYRHAQIILRQFDQAQSETFRKYSSQGIPYLVLIDDEGKALTAQPDNEWQSPQEVLPKIEEIVSGS